MQERRVSHTWSGTSIKFSEFEELLARFDGERYPDASWDTVSINTRPPTERSGGSTTVTISSHREAS
jgi:hypothetical protein